MSKEHPYHERSKGLIGVEGGGTEGCAVTVHGDGKYPDGQPQNGIDLGNVFHGETPHYDHPHGQKYRDAVLRHQNGGADRANGLQRVRCPARAAGDAARLCCTRTKRRDRTHAAGSQPTFRLASYVLRGGC